eukprot:sb/3466311/
MNATELESFDTLPMVLMVVPVHPLSFVRKHGHEQLLDLEGPARSPLPVAVGYQGEIQFCTCSPGELLLSGIRLEKMTDYANVFKRANERLQIALSNVAQGKPRTYNNMSKKSPGLSQSLGMPAPGDQPYVQGSVTFQQLLYQFIARSTRRLASGPEPGTFCMRGECVTTTPPSRRDNNMGREKVRDILGTDGAMQVMSAFPNLATISPNDDGRRSGGDSERMIRHYAVSPFGETWLCDCLQSQMSGPNQTISRQCNSAFGRKGPGPSLILSVSVCLSFSVCRRQFSTLYGDLITHTWYLRFQPEARTISTLKIGVEIKLRALKVISVLALVGVGPGIKSLSHPVN